MASNDKTNMRRTLGTLSCVVVAMFAFAVWVMPPIYDLICDIAGLNGKTKGRAEAVEVVVDKTRTIKVQFVAINNEDMPWDFKPEEFSLKVHPGEAIVTHFAAFNPTDKVMVGQAVPSMVPSNATNYFFKTECFCFNKQVLGPKESAELGLRFVVDQSIPKSVRTITLSYSLFDVTDMSATDVEEKTRRMSEEASQQVNTNQNKDSNESLILTALSK